jgi:hypothetical protein
MEIAHVEQFCLALGEPFARRRPLTLRTMTIPAAIEGDDRLRATFATRDVPTERCGATALDGGHHLELAEADMTRIGLTPCWAMIAEDIRNLQSWANHAAGRYAGSASLRRFFGFPLSPDSKPIGLLMQEMMPVATRV